jgi:hypothetical protein
MSITILRELPITTCRLTSGTAGWNHVRFFASLRMIINEGLRIVKAKVYRCPLLGQVDAKSSDGQ